MCRRKVWSNLRAWLTSNAGIYAKLPLSSFSTYYVGGGTTSTILQATPNADGAAFYYLPNNPAGIGGTSTTSFGVNQPMVCEAYSESTTAGSESSIWCAIRPTRDPARAFFFGSTLTGGRRFGKNSTLVGSRTRPAGSRRRGLTGTSLRKERQRPSAPTWGL